MYSSLQKIDLVVGKDAPLAVQTDHRAQAEIEAQRELSIVFALTRLLAPGRADAKFRSVHYVAQQQLPQFLKDLVRACGATFSEGGETGRAGEPPPADLPAAARMANDALVSLGRKVLERERLEPTLEGLAELEESVRGRELSADSDEIAYYEALVELAAAGGVVLAQGRADVAWTIPERSMSLVPLALERPPSAMLNVFGRVERFLDGEVQQGPSALARLSDEPGADDAPLVGVLKAPDWNAAAELLCEPLLAGDADGPVIVYGHDRPQSIAYVRKDSALRLGDAREQAQGFYRGIKATLERIEGELPLWAIAGDYYAPEKLLDLEFARGLHERVGAKLLLVALPTRGFAVVMAWDGDARSAGILTRMTEKAWQESLPADRISRALFVMLDGAITGVARESEKPAGPRKSLWRRLFGR